MPAADLESVVSAPKVIPPVAAERVRAVEPAVPMVNGFVVIVFAPAID